jgi:hypothetical protein
LIKIRSHFFFGSKYVASHVKNDFGFVAYHNGAFCIAKIC